MVRDVSEGNRADAKPLGAMDLPDVRGSGGVCAGMEAGMKWIDRCPCETGPVHTTTVVWLVIVALVAVLAEQVINWLCR